MNKIFNKYSYPIIAVILVGIVSFLLGGLLVHSLYGPAEKSAKVVLEPIELDIQVNRKVHASASGKRYYPWWCDAGNKIAKKNLIWYDTPEQAEKEGYSIAKGCQ